MTSSRRGQRLATASVAACLLSTVPLQAAPDVHLPQSDGATLTLPAPAERIITLAPNLAELVFAAGAGKHLKAVVEYSNFPPQVANLPRVGNAFRFDMERIVALKPDLVIAWRSGNPQNALQKLQQLGINIWQLEITQPDEIATAVENIAMAAGTEAQGHAAAEQIRMRLSHLRHLHSSKTPVDYFYQVATRPLYTINGQHIISRSLEICAAHNIFSDLPALAPQVSREAVILANPEVMFAPRSSTRPGALSAWQEWPQLRAVQSHALLYLPADKISQATPRLLDSIESACRLLDEVRAAGQEHAYSS